MQKKLCSVALIMQIPLQGPKLTFLGRHQLASEKFFEVAMWKNMATSCEILVASAKFLVALATRKAQFRTLPFTHSSCYVSNIFSKLFSRIILPNCEVALCK